MIRIFEGVPGSGKTYAMVHYLRRWADWDEFYKEWILKDGVIIISNIEDLRIPHLHLDRLLSELGSIRDVFSEKFIKTLWDKGYKKVIFAIDEAQKYFNRKFYDEDVFFFFQYHRHYGVDILLATQDVSLLPKEIRVLAEFIIRAEQRSLTLNSFKYKFYTSDNKTHLFNQTLKKDPKIFSMYKSFHIEEVEKPPNILARKLVLPLLLFIFFIALAWFYVKTFMFPDNDKTSPTSSVSIPQPSSPVTNELPSNSKPSFQSSSFSQGIPLVGYVDTGKVAYYLTLDRKVYADYYGSCYVTPYFTLRCVREPKLIKVFPPPPPPSPEDQTHPQGEGGLVHIWNKSHTPTSSFISLGGYNP